MADTIFDQFVLLMGNGTIDMDTDVLKIALVDDTYTIDKTDATWAEISGDELANGNGYTTGGETLTVTWTQSGGTTKFDATDVSWTAATFTARYAVIYDSTTISDNIICLLDFTENKIVTAGTFLIQFNISGIITIG